jgi:NAD(P)-dependent dehydrogenase (short-subunit alcohol dehydrogenase family)
MADEKNYSLLNEQSVLLITGGAKGITAQCAIRLAEIAACKFILLGRSELQAEEPAWAQGLQSAAELQKSAAAAFLEKGEKVTPKELQREVKKVLSSREIAATLAAITAKGGQACYIAADVTDAKSCKPKIEAAAQELGVVTGVIHGAGNLADKLIEKKTEQDYDLVVDTKVKGLDTVMQSVDPQKLDFLVLFSSVAGFFGNAGQADYAVANEVLNQSARMLHKTLPNCRVLAINWGPWDSGMVSPQLKKAFESRNIPLIQSEEGVETLVAELTGKPRIVPQLVVGSPIFAQNEVNVTNGCPLVIHRKINLAQNPFAVDHRIGPNAVLPATCASAWLINACEAANPGWKFQRMEDFKVLKGITLGEDNQEYSLSLERVPESTENLRSFDVVVTSTNDKGRKLFHYSGQVDLVKSMAETPNHPEILALTRDEKIFHDGRPYYEDGTFFHGPAFQGIQKVAVVDERKVVTRVFLPEMPTLQQGQFPADATNPYINDAIVQSMLFWSQEVYDAPCLPSRLHEWVQYRAVPFGQAVWAVLTVVNHNDHAISGDILVVDDAGNTYFQFRGLEGTVSKQLSRYIGRDIGKKTV